MRTIYCGHNQRLVFYGFSEYVLAWTGQNGISKENTVLCGSCNTAIFKWDVIPKTGHFLSRVFSGHVLASFLHVK